MLKIGIMKLLELGIGVSDWIQIGAIIINTVVAIVSICIAVATLKQTNKITKEANRAYLVATLEYTAFGGIKDYYLVIRNCGNTAAKINSITCSRTVDFFMWTRSI